MALFAGLAFKLCKYFSLLEVGESMEAHL